MDPPPGGCKNHRRKRRRRRGEEKVGESESKVQRGDVDGKVKGGGRPKRREEVRS